MSVDADPNGVSRTTKCVCVQTQCVAGLCNVGVGSVLVVVSSADSEMVCWQVRTHST